MLKNKFLFHRYKKEDFVLSDRISLESVEVRILPKDFPQTNAAASKYFLCNRFGWNENLTRRICFSHIGKMQRSHIRWDHKISAMKTPILFKCVVKRNVIFRTSMLLSTNGSTTTTLSSC